MALRIYLADLTHTGIGVANETFPLNIGLVASFSKKLFGRDVDVRLFKYPQDLLEGLRTAPPDILGCSNYNWNKRLASHFAQLAKSLGPRTVTVLGGTNYPFSQVHQERFLRARPEVDIHTFYEGEQAFANIVERVLGSANHEGIFEKAIDGCQFISPIDNSFVAGAEIPRIKNLDSIPSPYVAGMLDKFFDGVLSPLVETARGCPFTCNFCNAGENYFNKVNKFSDEYVREELEYVAQRASAVGVGILTLADNNFGMIPRDVHTVEVIHELQNRFGWPSHISLSTGKNSKERVIEATRLLGATAPITMAFQSINPKVLKIIKRSNIRLDDLRAISDHLHAEGKPQYGELIVPLPGETKDSMLAAVDGLVNANVNPLHCHTVLMLHGTPYKDDPVFTHEYGYTTKYRLAIRSFSRLEDKPIFDLEEVGISTKDLGFDDYLEIRQYLFIVEMCHNTDLFKPLVRYLKQFGIKEAEWIRMLFENMERLPAEVSTVFDSFRQETVGELWDSEESFVAHYSQPENFQELTSGERGGNVMFRHRVQILTRYAEVFIGFVCRLSAELLLKRSEPHCHESVRGEMDSLQRFVTGIGSKGYSPDEVDLVCKDRLVHDIPAWLKDTTNRLLSDFLLEEETEFAFYFDPREKSIRRDGFERYGGSVPGIIKQVQRRFGGMPPRSVSRSADPDPLL